MHDATNSPSNPEEEFQISQDKGAIIEAIDALFALADDNNVCLKCGESGHPNYECPDKRWRSSKICFDQPEEETTR